MTDHVVGMYEWRGYVEIQVAGLNLEAVPIGLCLPHVPNT